MTKEPIMIDGVNVKDCRRRIGKANFCRYYKRPCAENNYNCIWKKYLRKEQECEKFKAKYKTLLLEHSGCYRKEWVDEQIRIKKIYEEDRQNYGQALLDIKSLCLEQNLKVDFFACEVLQKCKEVLND